MDNFENLTEKKIAAKYMNIKEFKDLGLLQEVNRKFFHPMGLALVITLDKYGNYILAGVLDSRKDPEGFIFEKKLLKDKDSLDKMETVEKMYYSKLKTRIEKLGFFIQPIYQFENYRDYLFKCNDKNTTQAKIG